MRVVMTTFYVSLAAVVAPLAYANFFSVGWDGIGVAMLISYGGMAGVLVSALLLLYLERAS